MFNQRLSTTLGQAMAQLNRSYGVFLDPTADVGMHFRPSDFISAFYNLSSNTPVETQWFGGDLLIFEPGEPDPKFAARLLDDGD